MNDHSPSSQERGQSIILVVVALVAVVLFVAIAVDASDAYVQRRTAQNAADAAVLAASEELGRQINSGVFNDAAIKRTLNEFAERNGIEDTDGAPGNEVNANVEGHYLDGDGNRLGVVGASSPSGAVGIECTTYITAPTFFGGIFGLNGLPVNAEAAVQFGVACTQECLLPIAVHNTVFVSPTAMTAFCYDVYDGEGSGAFGWLNWSNQGPQQSCSQIGLPSDCSEGCLEYNLDHNNCRSGWISVGDWIAGKPGVTNADDVGDALDWYMGTWDQPGALVTLPVYDVTTGGGGCGKTSWPDGDPNNGKYYHAVGFAVFRITGYNLPSGNGSTNDLHKPDGTLLADPATCLDLGSPKQGKKFNNRITGQFIRWAGGEGGNCQATGNLLAPTLSK